MVIKYSGENNYISPETISEYVLVSNPTKVEMAASSIYGTLPRAPKCHRRGNSDAGVPAKYATYSPTSATTTGKKSFFAGLAHKLKYAVDGKSSNQLHRKLNWTPSEGYTGSTGSLQNYSPMSERKQQERPQRLWTRGLESMYASQRRLSSWKKSSIKKTSVKENVTSDFASSSPECSSSSAPSSPETQRTFISGDIKRLRRSRTSRKYNDSGYSSSLRESSNRDSLSSQFSNEDTKKSSGCKLLITGAEGVGKSALTVRFLTKRFIGEYAPEIESVYDQTMNIEGKDVNVHVWDSAIPDLYQNSNDDDVNSDSSTISHSSFTSSGDSSCRLSNRFSNSSLEDESVTNNNKPWGQDNLASMSRKDKLRHTIHKKIRRWKSNDASESEGENVHSSQNPSEVDRRLRWADGIVILYSICDQSSFDAARDVIRYVRQTEAAEISRQGANIDFSSTRIPILLVGNKLDLEHRRRVNATDARNMAASYACASCELSVSESFEPVSETLREHLKMVRKSSKNREALKSKNRKNKW